MSTSLSLQRASPSTASDAPASKAPQAMADPVLMVAMQDAQERASQQYLESTRRELEAAFAQLDKRQSGLAAMRTKEAAAKRVTGELLSKTEKLEDQARAISYALALEQQKKATIEEGAAELTGLAMELADEFAAAGPHVKLVVDAARAAKTKLVNELNLCQADQAKADAAATELSSISQKCMALETALSAEHAAATALEAQVVEAEARLLDACARHAHLLMDKDMLAAAVNDLVGQCATLDAQLKTREADLADTEVKRLQVQRELEQLDALGEFTVSDADVVREEASALAVEAQQQAAEKALLAVKGELLLLAGKAAHNGNDAGALSKAEVDAEDARFHEQVDKDTAELARDIAQLKSDVDALRATLSVPEQAASSPSSAG